MKKISKVWLVLLSALLLVMSVGCQDVRAQFDKFIQAEFVNAMESDYMTAHIYLEHPENFGVDMSKIGVNLGIRPDMEAKKEYYRTVKERYQEFKTFNRKQLTDDQKDTYDIYDFVTSLELQLNEEKFDYYQPLFQSMSGVHTQLPTLLSDWIIRNEQDVQDLIDLVEDIRPYVASALEYTKKQEELGLLMLDLQSVIDYCDSIVQSGENSAVLSSMNQSIDALSLPAVKSEEYKRQLKAAFADSLIPAYEEIRNAMQIFLNGNNNEEGLAQFPEGKEYFALLLQNNCGTNKSVEEIRAMMKERLNGHLSNLFRVMMVNPDFAEMLTGAQQPKTGFTSYTGMLDGIQQKMFQDFPQVSQLEYDIMDIHEEITSAGVAAYFNIPALDGTTRKQLRVNPVGVDLSSVNTYGTVAHEGFPGHMYQIAYMYENLDSPYRKTVNGLLAYTEGYAVYAQYEAQKYLKNMDQNLLEAIREQELAINCMMILADIGVHYDGWSVAEFTDFFSAQGAEFTEGGAELQYRQIQANPCAFEPYYVGYEEIAEMKKEAQKALGSGFNNMEFNKALLKSGKAPFSVVRKNIEVYTGKGRS